MVLFIWEEFHQVLRKKMHVGLFYVEYLKADCFFNDQKTYLDEM